MTSLDLPPVPSADAGAPLTLRRLSQSGNEKVAPTRTIRLPTSRRSSEEQAGYAREGRSAGELGELVKAEAAARVVNKKIARVAICSPLLSSCSQSSTQCLIASTNPSLFSPDDCARKQLPQKWRKMAGREKKIFKHHAILNCFKYSQALKPRHRRKFGDGRHQ
jgi:hypothetical protein